MAAGLLDADLAYGLAPGCLLRTFNEAGVLKGADVHVALALGRLGGDDDEEVALGAAMAVRAPRVGHVLVDLASIASTASGDVDEDADLTGLPWPAVGQWRDRLAGSPLVALGDDGPSDRPLRLVGTALYLDRYWRDEVLVASDLLARSAAADCAVDEALLACGLARLFPGDSEGLQCQAAATSALKHFSVIAGGPGTGKTTTVARLLALLHEQATRLGGLPPLAGLVAPTGKAAARMAEAVHEEACHLDIASGAKDWLLGLGGSTVHRLLGRLPASANRFRHDRSFQLAHDVVVLDETSMASLPLMARLLEAVPRESRLVLLGDHQQLAAVEAGAVLADIVGPAAARGSGLAAVARALPREAGIAQCITVLTANYRFRGALADLASAVRSGDEDATLAVLSSVPGRSSVTWLPVDVASPDEGTLAVVRSRVIGAGGPLVTAANLGDGEAALEALGRLRLLCAHRQGPAGARTWNTLAEQWLMPVGEQGASEPLWYAGRPVIVSENDYSLGLFNGDVGVTVAGRGGALMVAFRRGTGLVNFSPSQLPTVDTAFAMTAHRAQGSEFDEVVVLLPSPSSRILTRELLYTAITRAKGSVVLVGTEASVRAAVSRPVARASGLTRRLWGPPGAAFGVSGYVATCGQSED